MLIRVLVTSIGGSGVGSQILSALKLAPKDMLYLVGTDIKSTNVCKDLVDSFYIVPLVSNPQFSEKIESIILKEKIQVIFPSSLYEMEFFLINKERIERLGARICCNNSAAFDICRSKSRLSATLLEQGIAVPMFKKITSLGDCNSIDSYPVALKPDSDGMRSDNVLLALDRTELEAMARISLNRGITSLIAQEWIEDGEEYSISVISDENSDTLGSCAVKRCFDTGISVKQRIFSKGKYYNISSGITEGTLTHNQLLNEQIRMIAHAVGSTGPLNMQGIWKNSTFFVFDAHAAVTSGTYVRAIGGYNEPLFMVQRLLGHKPISLEYQACHVIREINARIVI